MFVGSDQLPDVYNIYVNVYTYNINIYILYIIIKWYICLHFPTGQSPWAKSALVMRDAMRLHLTTWGPPPHLEFRFDEPLYCSKNSWLQRIRWTGPLGDVWNIYCPAKQFVGENPQATRLYSVFRSSAKEKWCWQKARCPVVAYGHFTSPMK